MGYEAVLRHLLVDELNSQLAAHILEANRMSPRFQHKVVPNPSIERVFLLLLSHRALIVRGQ